MRGYDNRQVYVAADGPTVETGLEAGGLLSQRIGASVNGSVQVTGLMVLALIAVLIMLSRGLVGAIT